MVMVSAVSDRKQMDASGFLPLSVDYREKVCTWLRPSSSSRAAFTCFPAVFVDICVFCSRQGGLQQGFL